MSNPLHLNPNLYKKDVEQEHIRSGFGRGLLAAGQRDKQVVGLCADLTDSTKMNLFAETFPERFIDVGVAEQNLVTVAAGLAHLDKIPFTSSYAAFSPGRNWEQIRTTICLNDRNVKIVGSHAGLSVGPDGATHQMLEDIALMRVLPNMSVIVPCDSLQAEAATLAMAMEIGPMYLRLFREKSPVITTANTPFTIGEAYVYRPGSDLTIVACGVMVYQSLLAAEKLKTVGIDAEVINCATIKPLDSSTILASARKTGRVVTVEEAQVNGGLGGAVAELLSENLPVPLVRFGMQDRFGESGQPDELFRHFGLDAAGIAARVKSFVKPDRSTGKPTPKPKRRISKAAEPTNKPASKLHKTPIKIKVKGN